MSSDQLPKGDAASSSYPSISVGSYKVEIAESGWQDRWPPLIQKLAKSASKYVLLTDTNLDRLYGQTLKSSLQQRGVEVLYYALPPGEQTKSRETKAMIEDWMFENNCGRDTVILALGGGVIGDFSGYVASNYMRGIPFIQLPTSFLAMVDSSIGGKTGIDTPAGKNLLGAFHRPLAVLIDLSLLLTLPQRELCNGMAESIKAGVIASAELFDFMENNVEGLLKRKELPLLAQVVQRSVAIKADVVLRDELEGGLRSILNFGHSIGHAIEALSQPELLHGECVAIGMIEETILARSYGLVTSAELRRLDNILKSFSLPTRIPAHLTVKDLLLKMAIDKKNKNGKKELVLVTSIGSVKSEPGYTTMIPDADLELLLSPSIGLHALEPNKPIQGKVDVPGSKSLSNRILQLAAMGKGTCVIEGLLHSQDTQVMLDSLRQLGIEYSWEKGLKLLRIKACEGKLQLPRKSLFLNNAGTASRFLTSLVCLIPSGEITLTGNARMQERPIKDLVDSLINGCGCKIEYIGKNQGCLPIKITGNGMGLKGGEVKLAANISSQYVSSLLLAAPYAAETDLLLRLDQTPGKKVVSKPFIDMTVKLMQRFNIDVAEVEPFVYRVKRGAYANPPQVQVEGDASSATYPLALAAVTGGSVTVTNVGSDSLQGDALFCTVLEKMGCRVEQTATTTTVHGPNYAKGEKLKSICIDMDSMTDTFMTLAAVAVFAEGTTQITNIANQRVKECNRLAVMVENLTKIGVQAKESETGIDIVGLGLTDSAMQIIRSHIAVAPTSSQGFAVIECHDDHRIAMSFSIVACRSGNILLDEKRCVDKTYPEYWEQISKEFQIHTFPPKEGIVQLHGATPAAAASSSSIDDSSVVLIGMRGSGKSSFGASLAKALSRKFIDLDVALEQEVGTSLKEFVAQVGWPEFRRRELEVLRANLASNAKGAVISCGGGVVETEEAVHLLKKHKFVIQLRRDIEEVVQYLNEDQTRPTFDARAAWQKRQPLYRSASHHEFDLAVNFLNWPQMEAKFNTFVKRLLRGKNAHSKVIDIVPNTYFLSLTYPTLLHATSTNPTPVFQTRAQLATQVSAVSEGVDALEVRVDLVCQSADQDAVRNYLADLRSVTNLPLIYTVRSQSQGGKYPDYMDHANHHEREREVFELLALGMRCGVEFLDVEVALSSEVRNKLFALRSSYYPHVKFIASHHEAKSNGGSAEELKRLFDRCKRMFDPNPNAQQIPEIIKVVIMAESQLDAMRIIQVASQVQSEFDALYSSLSQNAQPKVIALAMGGQGKLSRVYNSVFTPVTHPLLPTAAAPGQLSVKQLLQIKQSLSLYPFNRFPLTETKQWLLFGSPITHSPSPLLHNTAFEWNGLGGVFSYGKLDTSDVNAVKQAMQQPDFGGGNVTIPLKEGVVALLDSRSPAVDKIGAVNTVIRRADGKLHGDNTDWQGVYQLLNERLSSPSFAASDVAVVIGAGGTARAAIYALQQLGFANERIILYNRTHDRAEKLAAEFHVKVVQSLSRESISEEIDQSDFTIRALVCTVPGSTSFRLSDGGLLKGQERPPVAFDASYVPANTAFLVQCTHDFAIPESNLIRGLDLLIAQGLFGMELWLGKKLPSDCKEKMGATVREAYLMQHQTSSSSPSP